MKPPVIKKVLIVYKKSSYQTHALEARDRNYLRLLRENNVATRRSIATHDRHVKTFETIKQVLTKLELRYDIRLRYHLVPITGYDLVVTVGGDGTFLETSHFVKEGLLLGVNSVPFESVGFFCQTNGANFAEKIKALLKGRAPIRPLHRLQAVIDGRQKLPLALNDILFTNQNPAGTTRYLIKIGGSTGLPRGSGQQGQAQLARAAKSKTLRSVMASPSGPGGGYGGAVSPRYYEEHKSSGVWISPAPGSSAATQSAGGKILPLFSEKFQYVVREPYEAKGQKYRFIKGVLAERQSVTLISMMEEASVYVDGPHIAFPVRRGSKIILRNAHCPLQTVW